MSERLGVSSFEVWTFGNLSLMFARLRLERVKAWCAKLWSLTFERLALRHFQFELFKLWSLPFACLPVWRLNAWNYASSQFEHLYLWTCVRFIVVNVRRLHALNSDFWTFTVWSVSVWHFAVWRLNVWTLERLNVWHLKCLSLNCWAFEQFKCELLTWCTNDV